MKLSGKIILLAAGTAILSSALTAGVMKEAFSSRDDFSVATADAGVNGNQGGFYTVGLSPATTTDFTQAAEKLHQRSCLNQKVISLPVSVRRDMEEVSL